MTMQAHLADGRVLEFPDGTDPAVVQQTVKKVLGQAGQQQLPTPNMPSKGIAGSMQILGTGVAQGAAGSINPDYGAERAGEISSMAPSVQQLPRDAAVNAVTRAGVQPQEMSGRLLQAAGQGAGGGATFGPAAMIPGALGGLSAQGAAEAGAPPWAQMIAGVAVPALAGKFGTSASRGQTTAALRDQSNASYAASRAGNLVVSQPAMTNIVSGLESTAKAEYLNPIRHPKSAAALEDLKAEAAKGPSTLDNIDAMRQKILGDVASSSDAGERRMGRLMMRRLDEQIEGLKPADVVSGDPAQAVADLQQGRAAWAKMRKSQMIEYAMDKAQRQAAKAGSGGNINNAIKQQFDAILNSPNKLRGFTADEQTAMRKIVDSGTVQDALRLVGKLSPGGNGLSAWLNLGAAMQTGGASLPITAAGMGAKALADNAARGNVAKLLALVQSGKVPRSTLTPTQQQMIDALVRGGVGAAGMATQQNQ